MTCEHHDDLVKMLATNTAATTQTLGIVQRLETKVERLSQQMASYDGAVRLVKTTIPWIIGVVGATIALATFVLRIL